MTKELDPTELVRQLNEQADFERFPERRKPGGSASVSVSQVIAGNALGCWCWGQGCRPDPDKPGHTTWPGKDEGAPHPRPPSTWQDQARRLPGGRS